MIIINLMNPSLNFPYYMYPATPLCEYDQISTYTKELERLDRELDTKPNPRTLFHLTIGAAMEEILCSDTTPPSYKPQWQQLMPQHIIDFVKRGGDCVHYIVSPNITFSYHKEYTDTHPSFIHHTPDFDWVIEKNYYRSRKYNYTVKIFCTMMPASDRARNIVCMQKLEQLAKKDGGDFFNPQTYRQTDYDNYFTRQFYIKLKNLIDRVGESGGFTTCFSFAVFNQSGNKSHIRDYIMFADIKSVFDAPNRFLAEWIYCFTEYLMIPYEKTTLGATYVSYTTNSDYLYVDDTYQSLKCMMIGDRIEYPDRDEIKKICSDYLTTLYSKKEIFNHIIRYDWIGEIQQKYQMMEDELVKCYLNIISSNDNIFKNLGLNQNHILFGRLELETYSNITKSVICVGDKKIKYSNMQPINHINIPPEWCEKNLFG